MHLNNLRWLVYALGSRWYKNTINAAVWQLSLQTKHVLSFNLRLGWKYPLPFQNLHVNTEWVFFFFFFAWERNARNTLNMFYYLSLITASWTSQCQSTDCKLNSVLYAGVYGCRCGKLIWTYVVWIERSTPETFWGAKSPTQFRHRWAERNHSDQFILTPNQFVGDLNLASGRTIYSRRFLGGQATYSVPSQVSRK